MVVTYTQASQFWFHGGLAQRFRKFQVLAKEFSGYADASFLPPRGRHAALKRSHSRGRRRAMTIKTTKIFAGMTLVAMLVASGTAFAGLLSHDPIKIRYSDLNLSTPEGARALYGRI